MPMVGVDDSSSQADAAQSESVDVVNYGECWQSLLAL